MVGIGEFTTHFRTYFSGAWDVQRVREFDPWPHGSVPCFGVGPAFLLGFKGKPKGKPPLLTFVSELEPLFGGLQGKLQGKHVLSLFRGGPLLFDVKGKPT